MQSVKKVSILKSWVMTFVIVSAFGSGAHAGDLAQNFNFDGRLLTDASGLPTIGF